MAGRNIDSDTHLIETAAIWEHMTEKERIHRPQPIELDEGILVPPIQIPMKSVWVIDGHLYARTNLEVIEEASKGQIKPGALAMTDPAARLKAMDQQGVDVHVLFPSLFLALAPESPAVELALTRSYNRFLAERCSGSGGRLRWVMLPALKSMDATLEEIAWARRNGACGVHLRGLEGDRPLDHPDFYPIYRVAQDLDMPICVHIGNASPSFRNIRRNAQNRPSRFHMSVPTLMSFTALATSEVSTLFPKLRFGFFEVGSSWLTYLVVQAHKVRDDRDRKAFTRQVLEERNLFVTCEEHEELPLILQYAGDNRIVIGSDYGHPGDVDETILVQQKLRARKDITEAQKSRILSGNAETLFGPG
ncbi:MAG: amidohydrolase family protein [Steroidobacteraceae bacterium]